MMQQIPLFLKHKSAEDRGENNKATAEEICFRASQRTSCVSMTDRKTATRNEAGTGSA